MNEHVDYQAKEASVITKFLWWCAGADPQILRYSSYSDHVKYVGIGGVVLATAVLAFLSMGFAMHIIFSYPEPAGAKDPVTGNILMHGNWFVTIPIALVWAIIILNLDRFIVSSTGKGDGKETMGFFELFNALPRLVMAVLIGFCISAPLETYIFSTEIDRELKDVKRKSIQMKIGQIETKYALIASEKDSLKSEKKKKLESLEQQKKFYEDEVMKETNNVVCGPRCVQKKEQQKKFLDETYNPALLEFQKAESESQDLKHKKEKEIAEMDSLTMLEKEGFLDKIMALEKLSEEKVTTIIDPISKKQKTEVVMPSAGWPIWLVRFLLMMLEIAPVLLKLMLIKGPYDYMSENINQILETKQGISIEHIIDEKKKITKFKTNFNPIRIAKIVNRQNEREAENAIEAIDSFAEKEKKEIKENPEKYIKDSNEDPIV